MSLLPFLFDEFRPTRRNFAVSLLGPALEEQLFGNVDLNRSLQELHQGDDDSASIVAGKDDFHASLDVQQFKPEEIAVKLTDNTVTVEGKHEERQDQHGFISRHFVRKYVLPEEYDADKLQSKLSSDGVLYIVAPKKPQGKKLEYREIPITLTGPVKSLGHKGQHQKKTKSKRLNKRGAHSICK